MATKYGAGAWTGGNPIGPSKNFVSPLGIDPSKAKDHPVTATELTQVLSESPGSGRLVSIPEGVTIKVPISPYGKTVKSGFILAGPGNLDWDYYGPTKGYMIPLLNLQEEVVISGVGLVEGGGGYGHYGQGAGPCAFRASGQRRIIIENVDLSMFRGAGVWFGDGAANITRWDDDTQRNILRHVKISHIQQYGFGYGVGMQGGHQSYLIEASIIESCRHLTMSNGGTTSAYELRYCILGDAVYANSDSGPASIQAHQVDVHGGGWSNQSYRCGFYLWVHYCDFSANSTFSEKPNVCIRGLMAAGGKAVIENCATKKRHGSDPSGAYTDLETAGNGRICMLAEAEGAPWKGPKLFSSAGVVCQDNWYGPDAPPDDETPPPPAGEADIQVIKLETSPVVVGQNYSVTATAENKGDAQGSKDVVIYWVPGSGSPVEVERQPVTLDPGAQAQVVQTAKSTAVGDWTFKAGDLTVVLKVLAQGTAQFEMSDIAAGALDSEVSLSATVKNTGTAKGTAVVTLSGDAAGSKAVTLEAGASQRVSFSITMTAK